MPINAAQQSSAGVRCDHFCDRRIALAHSGFSSKAEFSQ
jgi:hypothetical protein